MSLSVKIIDNDTGEVLVDTPNSVGLMGVVASNGEQHIAGKTEHIGVKSYAYVRCNRVAIYYMLEGLQKILIDTQRKYPNIERTGELLKLLSDTGSIIDKMERIMRDDDGD